MIDNSCYIKMSYLCYWRRRKTGGLCVPMCVTIHICADVWKTEGKMVAETKDWCVLLEKSRQKPDTCIAYTLI